MKLNQMKCTVCQAGDNPLNSQEISAYLENVSGWDLAEENGVPRIEKTYSFKDYLSALKFTNHVAELSEREGHHPSIRLDWGKVRVIWWTHKINGLHQNDFIMAAKTDQLYSPN
jgi:4a-hydroxytetrahydrobiopterin dehydratase